MNGEKDEIIIIPDPVGDRYASFGFMSWWEQQRVRAATVMVVGAGALGNEVIKNLTLMGIGRLFIVDFDVVEPGNLSRSVLFRVSDSGCRKVDAAAQAIKALNPDVAVHTFHGDINHELGLGVFRRMDAIVGCLDNREARLSLNRFCWQLGKPWIDGAIEALLGYVRVFWPGRGACYECTLTNRDYELINLRHSCGLLARENLIQGKVPTTPTAASIIGGMQTQEVLKILHGMEVHPGVSYNFNGLTNEHYATRLPIKQDCLSHDQLDEIVELPDARADKTTPAELLSIAQDRLGKNARLVLSDNLVVALRCKHCGTAEPILKPLYKLTEREAMCPHCKEIRMPDVINELTGEESYCQEVLRSLGTPPLAILTVYHGEHTIGLELTGDAEAVLQFESRRF